MKLFWMKSSINYNIPHMEHPSFDLPLIQDGEDKHSILKNRIRKNYRHLRKWAKGAMTNCFRIYDSEIKEFPLTIDYYAGRFSVDYFSSHRDEEILPEKYSVKVVEALTSLCNASEDQIYWRIRSRRKKTEQYEKSDDTQDFFIVLEHNVRFKVNLVDYLDTGLFLDHRKTRQMAAQSAIGKKLLNLFASTCSFSVHAAVAGAKYTKSVDMSNTYTAWGRDNFRLNQIDDKNHPIIRSDCLKFLETEREKYDVSVIDPPTLSRSKKMDSMFDIQKDHIYLITKALELLSPGGVIYFSTNSRKFTLDPSLRKLCVPYEITGQTIPIDFHDKKIHQCWRITAAGQDLS